MGKQQRTACEFHLNIHHQMSYLICTIYFQTNSMLSLILSSFHLYKKTSHLVQWLTRYLDFSGGRFYTSTLQIHAVSWLQNFYQNNSFGILCVKVYFQQCKDNFCPMYFSFCQKSRYVYRIFLLCCVLKRCIHNMMREEQLIIVINSSSLCTVLVHNI